MRGGEGAENDYNQLFNIVNYINQVPSLASRVPPVACPEKG